LREERVKENEIGSERVRTRERERGVREHASKRMGV
jgi:hypothetical protein